MKSALELPRFHRGAEAGLQVRSDSFSEKANTIDLIWTTGATVRRSSYLDGPYDEVLDVSTGAIRLERLNLGAPFLNTHSARDLDQVLGSVVPGTARIEQGEGVATVLLSRRPAVAGIVQDIRDGVIRNISCGYRVHKVIKEEAGKGDVALWRVVDWEPLELSAVPIGADAASQIRADAGSGHDATFPCQIVSAGPANNTLARMRMRAELARMIV